MLFLPTLFSSFIPYGEYIESFSNYEKCIISGIVNEISIEEIPSSLTNVYLKINGKEGIYSSIKGTIDLTKGGIDGGTPTYTRKDLPKLGDNIDYLMYKYTDDSYTDDNYRLLSRRKINDNEFYISGLILDDKTGMLLDKPTIKGDFNYCKPDEKYTKNSEIINFENGNNLYFSYASNGEIIMFLNNKPHLSQKALNIKLLILEKDLSNKNKKYIDAIVPNIKNEVLIKVYNNFTLLDLTGLGVYKDSILYLGNLLGLEIYKRFLEN